MSDELARRDCEPCRGGVPPLPRDRIDELLAQLDGWSLEDGHKLAKVFEWKDFAEALAFVDRVGAMAEEQWHHPDLELAWGRVKVTIWTHKIDGLTESDFVFAAKADVLARA